VTVLSPLYVLSSLHLCRLLVRTQLSSTSFNGQSHSVTSSCPPVRRRGGLHPPATATAMCEGTRGRTNSAAGRPAGRQRLKLVDNTPTEVAKKGFICPRSSALHKLSGLEREAPLRECLASHLRRGDLHRVCNVNPQVHVHHRLVESPLREQGGGTRLQGPRACTEYAAPLLTCSTRRSDGRWGWGGVGWGGVGCS
jgi:hypothetical protein